MKEMPPLPEPDRWGYGIDHPNLLQPVPGGPWVYWEHVAEQMQDYALLCVREALEEAARVCDAEALVPAIPNFGGTPERLAHESAMNLGRRRLQLCADAIRKMKDAQ